MKEGRSALKALVSGVGKKALLGLSITAVTAVCTCFLQEACGQQQKERDCATMILHERLLEIDPNYRENRLKLADFTMEYIGDLRDRGAAGLRSGIIRIPVVVHVVYHTAAENVSDAQIQSQIDVLNEDYRRLNADMSTVPAVFQPLSADVRIEFQLAVRDPDCSATTGITRTSTTRTGFISDDSVKSAATGGHDPWPRDKYLNMWVCNLTDYLGYAQFPGGPAATDGVVIRYTAFGDTGTAAAPFHLGRTATHEIGHWLNLEHIWGNDCGDPDPCAGSDFVADTPNQSCPNYGTPSFPHVSCSNGPNGDLFVNFMDYVDDPIMVMFTQGQVERMDGCLHAPHPTGRAEILGSDGLIPPPASPGTDLWSQDKPDDVGDEPNTISSPMYRSDDIWVRRTNDGLTNQDHENPEYRPGGSPPNYVYVRIRNKGCGGSGTGTVKLYWAKASTALGWPAPWDGSVTTPALMGGQIGSQSTGSVPGGGTVILEFSWHPPNPADYASFGADQSHFCLLSRIETSSTSPYGMTFPEGGNLNTNVRNNNNIVWKNVTVVTGTGRTGRMGWVTVGNITKEASLTKFVFDVPKGNERLFQWGRVIVDLGEKLFEKWREGGYVGGGFEILQEGRIQIVKPEAWIGGIKFEVRELHTIRVEFIPFDRPPRQTHIFELLVTQYAFEGNAYREVGGQRFVLKEMYRPTLTGIATEDGAVMLSWLPFGSGSYVVEYSDDPSPGGKWEPVPGWNWPTTETEWYAKEMGQFRQRYYRVYSR